VLNHRLGRAARNAISLLAIPVTVLTGVVATGSAAAAADQAPLCPTAATFATEIQWGGDQAPWHTDENLTVLITNRLRVLGNNTFPAGSQLSWSGQNGNGKIAFAKDGSFTGTAQFPGEGPVGYRGTAVTSASTQLASLCRNAASFGTEIQWGGDQAPWHTDEDLSILISNRRRVIGENQVPAGTQVAWTGPNGAATVSFGAEGTFTGTAQFPGEGPVGYRGTVD
jgi:OAA-family lectin sugar binding domain